MSRSKSEAFQNLKLDSAFFEHVLQKDAVAMKTHSPDYDIYLMEKSVMPVILQGLEALSRHVDKLGAGRDFNGGSKVPFNPLTWLAQYLLRNHPGKVKDHREHIYQQLAELANIERGRRCILRRQPEMEDEWGLLETERSFRIAVKDVPEYVRRLDSKWNLEGAFSQKLPEDFSKLIHASDAEGVVEFDEFWAWFEPFVGQNDLVRASMFDEALERREEADRLAEAAKAELVRHQQAMQEVMEIRKNLEDQFASISADLYTNEVVTQIINKTYTLPGSHKDQQEADGSASPAPSGEHVELIVAMLRLWGYVAEELDWDSWSGSTITAWQQWLEACGPEGAASRVDAVNIRRLIDREAFQAHLIKEYPAPDFDSSVLIAQGTVEVREIVEGDAMDVVVEAIDEETGEVHKLVLPESSVADVRRRLAEANGEPVLARVDLTSARVTSVLPPEA